MSLHQGSLYKIRNARSGYEIGRYAGKVGNVEMFVFNGNEILMLATSEIERAATEEEIKEEEAAARMRELYRTISKRDAIIQRLLGFLGIK